MQLFKKKVLEYFYFIFYEIVSLIASGTLSIPALVKYLERIFSIKKKL